MRLFECWNLFSKPDPPYPPSFQALSLAGQGIPGIAAVHSVEPERRSIVVGCPVFRHLSGAPPKPNRLDNLLRHKTLGRSGPAAVKPFYRFRFAGDTIT